MFSQNVAKITPPSHLYFRSQLPLRQDIKQWKAVYYFSGVANRVRRALALQEKAALLEATRAFEGKKAAVLGRDALMQKAVLQVAPAALASPSFKGGVEAISHIESLNMFGFSDLAHPYVQTLHSQGVLSSPADYAAVIRSYRSEGVLNQLLHTTAKYDKVLALKQMGDNRAAERAGEAARVLDMAHERFGGKGPALTHCYNAYMEVMLTCGYDGIRSIPNQVYDQMGSLDVTPTLSTYENVVLALGLMGEMAEAEQVANFVISRGFPAATAAGSASSSPASASSSGALSSSSSLTTQKLLPIYHSLLMGYRDNRLFDKCDQIWKELVQNRCPRPNATTADLYLRSIIDLSYTRTSDKHSKFVEMNMVEKKRIPLVLSQMDELGIPRTHLSLPVHHEVEDALRKFSIHKSRFYEWGRAVKQFDFVEFRRRNGWLYGLDEMIPTVDAERLPRRLPWGSDDGSVSAVGQLEVPAGVFEESRPWLEAPLKSVLGKTTQKERNDDTRAAEYFYTESPSVHDRSPTWSAEVPQTRFDQVYGLSRPNLHQAGIRRHMVAEWADGILGGEERAARDEAILKSISSTARRARHRPEVFSTHRTSPLDNM